MLYLLIFLYVLGYLLAFAMLRTEYEAEGENYTKGDRALVVFISLFSWLTIQYMLVLSWINTIKKTGYWITPVKTESIEPVKKP